MTYFSWWTWIKSPALRWSDARTQTIKLQRSVVLCTLFLRRCWRRCIKPHAALDKGELIIPDCIGCTRKEDFTLSFSHWPRKQQGTFISKPFPHILWLPKSCSSAFQGRHYRQAALQIRLVISSDVMADLVGEKGFIGWGALCITGVLRCKCY